MKPENISHIVLAITRSRAKMFEYSIPTSDHIEINPDRDPSRLFTLTIGVLGEYAARSNDQSNLDDNDELKKALLFSSHFFDAYLESQLNQSINSYVLMLASASYYLCDLPGCSKILSQRIDSKPVDFQASGLDTFLQAILHGNSQLHESASSIYESILSAFTNTLREFRVSGNGIEEIRNLASRLRRLAYSEGTPGELLFADVLCAYIIKKCMNSAWYSLPLYTDLPKEVWREAIQRPSFLDELWPSQHLLGKHNIFRGKSAVVQMPTSAGKTKSTEIIIRSAFLAGRTSLAVVIAPFRALCHEISDNLSRCFANDQVTIDELSDVLQRDFNLGNLNSENQILVATPEKFLYVLRHHPELAEHIGLVIFDEGHQFDSGTRGITYELLLTSLNMLLHQDCQKVLISAVIMNAETVNQWMNGSESEVAQGSDLSPTLRTVAFASWLDTRGRLEFVDEHNIDSPQFFVPRLINSQPLQLRGKERKPRPFPSRKDGNSIALYLGLKMNSSGGVAVFCGKKATVGSLCKMLSDAFERGVQLEAPSIYANHQENEALHLLYQRHLGADAPQTRAARLGAFTHHGDTPEGIRLAVEYAMREELIHFVICTSTLAQGVNLPIRYLIVTDVRQGTERIKARDFHNLIGRAGRAGMHTEGSVIFSDPKIYDGRKVPKERWRWNDSKILLDPSQSEPCLSNLLSLFKPFMSDDGRRRVVMEPLSFVQQYVNGSEDLEVYIQAINKLDGFSEPDLRRQIVWRTHLITAVESFLLSHLDSESEMFFDEQASYLAEHTFAYYIANESEKETIISCFRLLAGRIQISVNDAHKKAVYSRTLLGLNDAIEINQWVSENIQLLISCKTFEDILLSVWPICEKFVMNKTIKRCDTILTVRDAALQWISGQNFTVILEHFVEKEAKMNWGKRKRDVNINDVVDVCQNGFAYDMSLIIGALAETAELVQFDDKEVTINILRRLQKSMKYGLPEDASLFLFEKILPDRTIAMDVAYAMNLPNASHTTLRETLKSQQQELINRLSIYPRYFQFRANQYFA